MGVDEALRDLLAGVSALPAEPVELDEALGLVLGESLEAQEDHPSEDISAMDGYAVRAENLRTASLENPVVLPIGEDIRAGFPPSREVSNFECARISTGALVPAGADSVEMREYVDLVEGQAVFSRPIASGANVRYAGEHLRRGESPLAAGVVLGPSQLGMAAHMGYLRPLCHPRLKVAILATGSELVEGGELARGQIRDSNGIALASAVRHLGCSVSLRERVADEESVLGAAIDRAVASSHVLLTSGGISAGWHDLVRERIEAAGGEFVFHKLRMRPGKPVAFGRIGALWVFCLPGNPVSSLVTFEVFVKPAMLKLMGRPSQTAEVRAELAERVEKKQGFTVFFRVCLEERGEGLLPLARLTGPQASHHLKSLVDADGLMVLGEEVERLEPGQHVQVRLWS